MGSPFVVEEDKGKASPFVRNARSTRTYSFLPASWTGDTHEETNFLPIGDREERERQLLNRRTDNPETRQVLVAKFLQTRFLDENRLLATNKD